MMKYRGRAPPHFQKMLLLHPRRSAAREPQVDQAHVDAAQAQAGWEPARVDLVSDEIKNGCRYPGDGSDMCGLDCSQCAP